MEDVVSVDIYPDPRDPLGARYGALIHDMTRSQAHGGPWMVMEQAAGPVVDRRGVNHPKPRGLNRLWSLQAVARGADAVCYFQWRQSRRAPRSSTPGWSATRGAGPHLPGGQADRGRTRPAERQGDGHRVVGADVAVLLDWNAWWASQQDGRLSSEVDHQSVVRAWHRALWEANTTTSFAHPEHDLSGYKLVVVPQLYLLTDRAIDNLVGYVRGGGTLVSGFLTGVADQDDRVRPGGMDQRLRALFGIRTLHEWWPLDADEKAEAEGFRGTLWSEEIKAADDTYAVVRYEGGELDGLPAVLRKGRAWYLSTLPEPEALWPLLAGIAEDAGVRPPLDHLPADVEAVRRGELLFLLHHGRDTVTSAGAGTPPRPADRRGRRRCRGAGAVRRRRTGGSAMSEPAGGPTDAPVHGSTDAPVHGTWEPAPAARWEDAFLSGNGRHGVMVFGDPNDDRVIVNHHSLVRPNGGEHSRPPELAARLRSVQDRSLAGDVDAGEDFTDGRPLLWVRPFHPAFQVRLRRAPRESRAYRREVDFATGVVRAECGGRRGEVFVSRADDVIVQYVREADLTVDVTLDHRLPGVPVDLAVGHWLRAHARRRSHPAGPLSGQRAGVHGRDARRGHRGPDARRAARDTGRGRAFGAAAHAGTAARGGVGHARRGP